MVMAACAAGLFSIRNVTGNVQIRTGATSLIGLNKLSNVGGDVDINYIKTKSLAGLEKLKTIGGRLGIEYCKSIKSLEGLSGLTNIVGDLRIGYNDFLRNLSGISPTVIMGGGFYCVETNMLEEITLSPQTLKYIDIIGQNSLSQFNKADGAYKGQL